MLLLDSNSADPRQLGQRLQDARRATGQTQQAVADEMGLARTTIVAIEKGERKVSPNELIRLAKIYHRPVSDFAGQRVLSQGFLAQFRSNERKALETDPEYEAVALALQQRAEDYFELERFAASRLVRAYPPLYETAGVTAEQVAIDVATAERNRLGLGDGPIGNLRERLDAEVGLRIFYYPMPAKIAGAFAYNEDLGACIGINANHPRDRRQWSLAHEFGHFLMHRFQAEITILDRRQMGALKERLTDSFAENFLMPASGLNRRFSEIHRSSPNGVTLADVVGLADLYRVSVQALVLRLETLRRVATGTWERLVSGGYAVRRAQEVAAVEAEDAFPARYYALATSAFRRGELSEGQLAKFLRTDRLTARAIAEAAQHRIQAEREGDFTDIEMDLLQPIGSK